MTHRTTVHLVILAFVGLNLLYVAFACPFDLSPDEAHYWDWSRRLDFCYYSKGPVVALLIRGSCELLGDTAFAVRLPAVLCGGLLLVGLHRLTVRTTNDERLALGVVLAAITLPPVAVGSVLMTIDPPFLACWVWAAALLWEGEAPAEPRTTKTARREPRPPGGWPIAGLLVAVGTLAKPTMLLFPLCVLGWLVATGQRVRRAHLAFFAISLLGLVPILGWNAIHDWLGVRHLLGHAGAGSPWAGPLGVLGFLGGQLGLLLGVWFVFWVLAVFGPSRKRERRSSPGGTGLTVRTAAGGRYTGSPNRGAGATRPQAKTVAHASGSEMRAFLWWLSVPVFAVFLLASVRTSSQPNWPLPAYLTGAVLVAVWVKGHAANRYVRRSLILVAILGVSAGFLVRFPRVVRPLLAELVPEPSEYRPAPVRQLDPTARLLGWKHLAGRVDAIRDRVAAETGTEPLVAGMTWVIPGELGFYCRGNPEVFTFGVALADRFSQYDVWRPNPVADAQEFAGRTFVYVGEAIPDTAFEQVELAEAVVARDNRIPVANWRIWVCRGFRGFGTADGRHHPPRY